MSCLFALAACGNADQGDGVAPSPSFSIFQNETYPVLLRDCGFSGCHGAQERFFLVYGPGRTRLSKDSMPSDPPTMDEVIRSYDRARSMLAGSANIDDSLLLRKPLEASQGGQAHKGTDSLDRNVYRFKQDPAYSLLLRWAHSSSSDISPVNIFVDAGAAP